MAEASTVADICETTGDVQIDALVSNRWAEECDVWHRLAASAVGLGTWMQSMPYGDIVCSDMAAELLGLPRGDSSLSDLIAAFHPADQERIGAALRRAADGAAVTLDARLAGPNSASSWVRFCAVAEPSAGFDLPRLHGVVVPMADPAGAGWSDQLASILDASDDAIIGRTLDGIVTSWNAGAERVFGYRAAEILGHPISRLAVPGQADKMRALLARIRRGESINRVESWRRRKDGTIIRVRLTVSPIRDAAGRLVGASELARDITSQRRTEKALRDAEAELQSLRSEILHLSRLSTIGQHAATVAHELNQPLTAIVTYLRAGQAMLGSADRPALAQRAGEAMRRALEQALRAGQIIRGLRSFSGQREGERHHESVADMVEATSELAMIAARPQGVSLRLVIEPECGTVLVDRAQIQQVLHTLMRRSIEAMAGAAQRELVIGARMAGQRVVVEVADTSAGPPPELGKQLLPSLVAGKAGGMDVKLSVCVAILKVHGSTLRAEARPEGGVLFRFELPTRAEDR